MRLALVLSFASLVALGGGLRAQGVPAGDHIVSIFQNVTSTTTGLLLLDRAAGTCKPVKGLSQAAWDVNAVQIDPVNESVWIGSLANAEVRRITIDANCNVSGERLWGLATSTTATYQIAAIAFDNNGNPAVAGGNSPVNGGGVFLLDRNNPGNGVNISGALPNGEANALCRDDVGNLYVGVTGGSGGIFMLPVQRDCTYGPPVFLGTITPASNSNIISGIDYCGRTGDLWWTSFGSNGTAVGNFALPNGPAAVCTSTLPALNAIEYDVNRGDFTLVTAGPDPDTVFSMDKSCATSTACVIPPNGQNGVPSGIDACDCTEAETLIVPKCVTGNVRFNLELGVCCNPGDLGGVFIIAAGGAPLAIQVIVGTAPASGRITTSFGNLVLPPGTPAGLITFISACADQRLTRVVIGAPVLWPSSVN